MNQPKAPFEILTPELSATYLVYLELQLQSTRLIDENPDLRELLGLIDGRGGTKTSGPVKNPYWIWAK